MTESALSSVSSRFGNCWINVNRECNIRCKWCYARPVGYSKADRIDLAAYRRVIPIVGDLGIRHLTILGGEPTASDDLPEIIRVASDHGLTTTLVSNGIALADNPYLSALLDSGLGAIDISLKGSNEEEYIANTRFHGFETVMKAVSNVAAREVRFSVSMVLSADSVGTASDGLRAAAAAGAEFFSLSFCYDFSGLSTPVVRDHVGSTVHDDVALIRAFEERYPILCEVTGGRFSLMQSYPLCLWNPTLVRAMLEKGQVNSVCQLLEQGGLVLDTDFSIIPCNAMSKFKLGEFDIDWHDARSLLRHMDSETPRKVVDFLGSAPSEVCLECELWPVCGGGCVSFWVNNRFSDIVAYRQEWGLEELGLQLAGD